MRQVKKAIESMRYTLAIIVFIAAMAGCVANPDSSQSRIQIDGANSSTVLTFDPGSIDKAKLEQALASCGVPCEVSIDTTRSRERRRQAQEAIVSTSSALVSWRLFEEQGNYSLQRAQPDGTWLPAISGVGTLETFIDHAARRIAEHGNIHQEWIR